MTVKGTVNTLVASHPQKEVAQAHLYAQRKTFHTADPLKPIGDQARYNEAWVALQQVDEKSAAS